MSNVACKTDPKWKTDESDERKELQAGVPCVIPFWYNGKKYNGCTDVNSKDIGENTWCATVATSENDKEDFDIAYGVCSGDLACKRHNGTNVNSNIILHQYGITKIYVPANDLVIH